MKTTFQPWLLAIAGILVALSFGFSYGNVGNQATYLPHALNHVNPDFLRNDWLVTQTTVYHGNFRWVVLLLVSLGSLAWGTALLNTALIFLSLYLIHRWHDELHRPSAYGAAMLTVLFALLDQTRSVGDSYLFSSGLQPSVLASTAWIGAILYFFRSRYLVSGCLLALGGLFHANFLVLGVGLFTLAHLLLGKERCVKRLLAQLGPSLLVLLFTLPMLLAAAGGDEAQLARKIFLEIRAPHHYLPSTYSTDFLYLGGWTVCGLAAVYAMSDLPQRRALASLIGALAISITGATLLTTVVFVPPISQLYVWRLAPFLQILCQCSVAIFLVRQLTEHIALGKRRVAVLLAFAIGVLAILRWTVRHTGVSLQAGAMLLLVGFYLVLWWSRRRNMASVSKAMPLFSLATLAFVLGVSLTHARTEFAKSTLLHPQGDTLFAWARTTPPGAIFLVPPELGDFRLLGERAVVVDWKSTPILPKELVAWYGRMNAVSGQTVHGYTEAVDGYRRQSWSQLNALAARFGAAYIVVDKRKHGAKVMHEAPVFQNEAYSVYASGAVNAEAGS